MNKASCLSLVSNAILYWNTTRIGNIVDDLREQGESVEDETLRHISLLPEYSVKTVKYLNKIIFKIESMQRSPF